MLLMDLVFHFLTFAQSLVWVDFVVKFVTFIVPNSFSPPLLAFIIAIITSAIATAIAALYWLVLNRPSLDAYHLNRVQTIALIENPVKQDTPINNRRAFPRTQTRALASHRYASSDLTMRSEGRL